jgi:hypothetical protein
MGINPGTCGDVYGALGSASAHILGGPGHDRAYKLINDGVLRPVKDGRNTLILAEDFTSLLDERSEGQTFVLPDGYDPSLPD